MPIPTFRLIQPQIGRSYVFKLEPFGLHTPWHYHPELELIYFIEGKTSGVIGERMMEFNEGDLVLLGANFPHVLQEHLRFKKSHPNVKPFGLIIQFTEEFLGPGFFDIPEMSGVKQLLIKAKHGIIFDNDTVKKVAPILSGMYEMNNQQMLVHLLNTLITLTQQKRYRYLTPIDYSYKYSFDEERMIRINTFIYENFKEPVTVADVAGVANMTVTSFCRYFKSRTLKTFVQFLNEVRISSACGLLNNDNFTITDVCFEVGFNSLSYFNRQFRSIMKMSPMQYRKWKNRATNKLING